jgi:hypothetical protein
VHFTRTRTSKEDPGEWHSISDSNIDSPNDLADIEGALLGAYEITFTRDEVFAEVVEGDEEVVEGEEGDEEVGEGEE